MVVGSQKFPNTWSITSQRGVFLREQALDAILYFPEQIIVPSFYDFRRYWSDRDNVLGPTPYNLSVQAPCDRQLPYQLSMHDVFASSPRAVSWRSMMQVEDTSKRKPVDREERQDGMKSE